MTINQTLKNWEEQDKIIRNKLAPPASIPVEKISMMSGMQVFEAIFSGDLPSPPIGDTLDFIPIHMEPVAFPQISRQIMMSKLKWRNANATNEICPRVQRRGS